MIQTHPFNALMQHSRKVRLQILVGLVTAALIAPAAMSQDTRSLLRDKTWTAQQTQEWMDYHDRQSFQQAFADDCPDFTNRRNVILNGNKITTEITNFGSISSPGNRITDIVWNGLGYGYEFGPFVAAEVIDEGHQDPQSVQKLDAAGNPVLDANGDPIWVTHIVSDGLTSNGGEVSPAGNERWGWLPIPCAQPVGNFAGLQVVNPNSPRVPVSDAPDDDLDGKPDSWPDQWYNEALEDYVWPGALQQGSSNADQESIYFMNDYGNREFKYQPFENDTTRRGLGLEVETRLYQWANPLAEDAIFLIYKITNKSDKDLDNVIFGMWGDPHIGGPSDWADDLAFFDRDLNMVFAFDANGLSDVPGRAPGYFGYKFLESPGVGTEILNGVRFEGDGIDNDNDGMLDESWTDGIDNDGDWDPETDDTGIDGVPGTGDEGEGDGVPTAGDPFDITKPGEPNFEFTDIDESDQIGLTSFTSPPFAGNRISNDERVWSQVQPGVFDDIPEDPGDYVFIYGSGSFALRAGETKRFSIALIVGESLDDLILNAETVQQIFDVGYRFAKPPDKPKVNVVAGDKKVTLYWDAKAEDSVDPLSRTKDFEGYVIYRSTTNDFADQQTITDINGTKFLYQPLKTELGVEAKFDLKNGITGPSPIVYPRRGVAYDLGEDTGLFHTFVDSNNVINGQTYYYAVSAYDRGFSGDGTGDFPGGIAPSETTRTITYNPTNDRYIFDVNTGSATPGPPVAGYMPAALAAEDGLVQSSGNGTGDIVIKVVDEFAVPEGGLYSVFFNRNADGDLTYTVQDERVKTIELSASPGKFVSLGFPNIDPNSFTIGKASGGTLTSGTDFTLNPDIGTIQVANNAATTGDVLVAMFKYSPIKNSPYIASEETNPVFDGLHLFVKDVPMGIDPEASGWAVGGNGATFEARVASSGPRRIGQPFDYEIRFGAEGLSTSLSNNVPLPFEVVNVTKASQKLQLFTPDVNRNGAWDSNEPIIFIDVIEGVNTASWEVEFTSGYSVNAGDVFMLKTSKPFLSEDRFTIRTAGPAVDPALATSEMENIYVVPNPYVATNELEPRNPLSNVERGERRLYFANVPAQCTISIFTLAGELVEVINHDGGIGEGKAYWDLRTKDNMNIAHGLYIYHVESEHGTFIDKFAVIK